MVVPSGIVTDYSTRYFTQSILRQGYLKAVWDFDNRGGLFEDVQGNVQFAVLTLGKLGSGSGPFVVRAKKQAIGLGGRYEMSHACVRLINPETQNIPLLASRRAYELILRLYSVFSHLGGTGCIESLKQGQFNMTSDANLFSSSKGEGRVALYEAKLCHQFNHRLASFEATDVRRRYGTHAGAERVPIHRLQDVRYEVESRYWIDREPFEKRSSGQGWALVYRNSMSALADARSCVATVLPKVAIGNSLSILSPSGGAPMAAVLVSYLNSFVVD